MAYESDAKKPVVLVVEDEFLVRMDVAASLGAAGLTVLEASNADEAIEILEGRDDVRLVFTDVDMPGSMDGLKLAQYVRQKWPPIKLIIASGHVNVKPSDIPTGGKFLPKPYQAAAIVNVVNELMVG